MEIRRPRLSAIALFAILTVSCGIGQRESEYDAHNPEHVALRLFVWANETELSDDALRELFGPVEDLTDRANLYDSIEGIRSAQDAVVTHVEALPHLGSVAVDLASRLAGGGEARYSVHLGRAGDDEPWTIRWFRGPGVQWPVNRVLQDSGLSSSHPPE